jgi:hypothetical protein
MQALGLLAQAYYKSDELDQVELNLKKRWILPKRRIASRKTLKV